jgi:uncharacterized membrane protein YhaH (DUF805 family)
MRGVIQAIAADGTYGQISAEDGTQYSYWTIEIEKGIGRVGQAVEFQISDGQPIDIVLTPPAPAVAARRPMPPAAVPHASPTSVSVSKSSSDSGYWVKLFTSPNGRISRRQFWLHGALPIFVANIVLGWIPVINILVFIAVFWGSICICFKRFHDRGLSGLWSFLNIVPSFIALALSIGAMFAAGNNTLVLAGIFGAISLIVTVAQFFTVYVRAGQQGDNQYGPDPLAAPPY